MPQSNAREGRGKRKVKFTEQELAECLDSVSDPNSPDYDPEYVVVLKSIRPGWSKEKTKE